MVFYDPDNISSFYSLKEIINDLAELVLESLTYVTVEPRIERAGKYIVFSFTKDIGEEIFVIPNFNYPEKNSISRNDSVNVIRFAKNHGISEKDSAFTYVKSYSNHILSEYEKSGVYKILSNRGIGETVIFFPTNEDEYIAYSENVNKVLNEE